MVHRKEEGLEILKRLHRTLGDSGDILAHEEYYQICGQIALDAERPTTFWQLIKLPSYRRRFLIGFFLQ